MKKILIVIILLIIVNLAYAKTSANFVTVGLGNTLWCQIRGSCSFDNLEVGNLTIFGEIFNVTVEDTTVNGTVDAHRFRENGTDLHDIFVDESGDTITWLNISGDLYVETNSTFNGTLLPVTSLTWDIGSGTNRWRNLYIVNLSADYIDATYGISTSGWFTADYLNITDVIRVEVINASYIYNPFSPGGMDIRGDPWYLSGTDLQIAEDLIVDGSISQGGNTLDSTYVNISGDTMTGGLNISSLDDNKAFAVGDTFRVTTEDNISTFRRPNIGDHVNFISSGFNSGTIGSEGTASENKWYWRWNGGTPLQFRFGTVLTIRGHDIDMLTNTVGDPVLNIENTAVTAGLLLHMKGSGTTAVLIKDEDDHVMFRQDIDNNRTSLFGELTLSSGWQIDDDSDEDLNFKKADETIVCSLDNADEQLECLEVDISGDITLGGDLTFTLGTPYVYYGDGVFDQYRIRSSGKGGYIAYGNQSTDFYSYNFGFTGTTITNLKGLYRVNDNGGEGIVFSQQGSKDIEFGTNGDVSFMELINAPWTSRIPDYIKFGSEILLQEVTLIPFPPWYTDEDRWIIDGNQEELLFQNSTGNTLLELQQESKVEVHGDLNVTGNFYNKMPHMQGLTTTIHTVAVIDTWYNISFNTSLGFVEDINFTENRTIIITEDGDYSIRFGVSVEDSSPLPNSHVAIRISVNGVELEGSYKEFDPSKQNSQSWLDLSVYAEGLSTGDELNMQYIGGDTDISVTSHSTYAETPFVAYGFITKEHD